MAGLMLVRVMSEMLASAALFVLAIGFRRRPGGLERQHHYQKDEEEASKHGARLYIHYGESNKGHS